MKIVSMIYLMLVYIIALPLALIYSTVYLIYACIRSKIEFGEADVKGYVMAMFEGLVEGHQRNVDMINERFSHK